MNNSNNPKNKIHKNPVQGHPLQNDDKSGDFTLATNAIKDLTDKTNGQRVPAKYHQVKNNVIDTSKTTNHVEGKTKK